MGWCPECGYEYEPEVKACPECGVALVDERPPVPRRRSSHAGASKPVDAGAHGPDTEPGRWCPQCRTQYRPDVTVCADCGTLLVDTPPQLPSSTLPSLGALVKGFLARLAGMRGLPPSFIERFLNAPCTRWNPVLSCLASFALCSVARITPAAVFTFEATWHLDATRAGSRWVLALAGCPLYMLAGYVSGSIQRRLGWVCAVGGIAGAWFLSALDWVRTQPPQYADWFWIQHPGYLALAAGWMGAAAIMAWVAGKGSARMTGAAACCAALGVLWARELSHSWFALFDWLIRTGRDAVVNILYPYFDPSFDALGALLAAIGVGWLARRNGWALGMLVALIAFGRVGLLAFSHQEAALFSATSLASGAVGGLIGQELVAGFVRWRQRRGGILAVVIMGAVQAAGLTAIARFTGVWSGFVVYMVLGTIRWPRWLEYAMYFVGVVLFGAVVGRIMPRSARFAASVAAGAVALRYLIRRGSPNALATPSTAAAMALAAAAAFAIARVYARRAAQSQRGPAPSEGVAGEVKQPTS
jgi:hypothetical protein